jgi:hypothetical protein
VYVYQTRSLETRQSRPDMLSYSVRGIPSQLPPHRGGSCEAGDEEEEEEEEEEHKRFELLPELIYLLMGHMYFFSDV